MNNRTIVCIEHTNSTAAVLVAIFKDLGFNTVVFHDGAEAAKYTIENPVEMVIVNARINGEDSLPLVEELRAACTDSTRIVAITSSKIPQDHKASIDAGVDSVLIRPYTHLDVANTLSDGGIKGTSQKVSNSSDSLDAALRPTPTLDLDVLYALIRDISVESTEEALKVFIEDLKTDLEDFVELDGDSERYAAFAHTTKCVASTFGAKELARAAEDLEVVSRLGGTAPELNALLGVVNDRAAHFIESVNELDLSILDVQSAILSTGT